jgi:hypothetical protein
MTVNKEISSRGPRPLTETPGSKWLAWSGGVGAEAPANTSKSQIAKNE